MTQQQDKGDDKGRGALSRRLAAVLFLDVVGYTKRMEQDERGTHQRWMALRAEVIEPRVTEKQGSVVKSTGDGLLLEFPSASGAVGFALDVQQHLAKDLKQDASGSLQLRMAGNIVDIITERDDVYGDGVNIAARLLDFADPGGIVITSSLQDQIREVLPYQTADLGFLTVKNVERRIRAFKIAPLGFVALRTERSRSHRPSIAVLPLRVLGGEQSDSYRSEGLVHEIVASLAALHELFVISSNSTMALAETSLDPANICNRLGVRYLLTGRMLRRGESLRVSVELSDTDSRSVIWTDQQTVQVSELFSIQDEIASKIAHALLPHIRSQEMLRASRKRPENVDAYDLTLKAMYRLYRLGSEDFNSSKALLEAAIEQDPHSSMALALMAKWHILYIGEGHSKDMKADSQAALSFASRALEYNSSDPLALAIFGHIRSFLFADFEGAIEAFDRAVSASPNSAIAWGTQRAHLLLFRGW